MLSTLVFGFIRRCPAAPLLADQPPLLNQPFDILEGLVINLLFFVGFEQFALRFQRVRLGDVHRDPDRNLSRSTAASSNRSSPAFLRPNQSAHQAVADIQLFADLMDVVAQRFQPFNFADQIHRLRITPRDVLHQAANQQFLSGRFPPLSAGISLCPSAMKASMPPLAANQVISCRHPSHSLAGGSPESAFSGRGF